MARRAAIALAASAALLAACGGDDTKPADQTAEVKRIARAYYFAFERRDLKRACGYVAHRLLPTITVVGVNTADGEGAAPAPKPYSLDGCTQVHQRRAGWQQRLPDSAWEVEGVELDKSGLVARVDTSAEGSYWLQRDDEAQPWRIVALGPVAKPPEPRR